MLRILSKYMTITGSEVMSKEKIFEELKPLFDAILDSVIAEIPRDDNVSEFVDFGGVENVQLHHPTSAFDAIQRRDKHRLGNAV